MHLSRIAEVFFVWHTSEFAFIEFDDEYASVSSIMPQKKNPGPLEFIKKGAGHLIGSSTQVLAAAKSSWFTDAADATDAGDEPLLDATGVAVACMEMLAGCVDTMQINADRMLEGARAGYGTMTEVADTIVRESGVSFRVAHNIVGKTVQRAIAEGKAADEVTHEMLDQTSRELFSRPLGVSAEAIGRALDPVENIKLRTVRGGTAPDEMARMLAERRDGLNEDFKRFEDDSELLDSRRAELLDVARLRVGRMNADETDVAAAAQSNEGTQ